jgi:cyclopropane fatty-acyl-phospholipid synthase-like methyltransferase
MSDREKSDRLRLRVIKRFLTGKEILDIGSSEGEIHRILKADNGGKKFFSMDKTNADFNIDLDRPKKINRKFDCIIAGEIIEHLESPIVFVRYCKSLLKKGGRIILTTPNATGLQYLLNPNWCVVYPDYRGHSQAFTLGMLRRLLEDEGFNVKFEDYINAFWKKNPIRFVSFIFKRLRPDLIIVADI